MEPSKKQIAVYEEWKNTDRNILVNACAGSGKTFTLMQVMKIDPKESLFLAFNKSIQKEIEEKINKMGISNANALTLHSLGLRTIRAHKSNIEVDNNKGFKVAIKVVKSSSTVRRSYLTSKHFKIVFYLIDMFDTCRNFLVKNISTLKEYMLSMDKNVFSFKEEAKPSVELDKEEAEEIEAELVDTFFKEMFKMYDKKKIIIDFTDMIFLPVYLNLKIPLSPSYLFLDECQDFNLCQHRLIKNFISQGSIEKWIAAGDPHQAIYGFSGSHSESFDMFKNVENTVELPLDICYRCDTNIVDSANSVFNIMTPFKKSKGIVEDLTEEAYIEDIKDGSMILCRNSSPLVSIYFRLIGEDKQCFIKGKEIHKAVVNFCKDYKTMSVNDAKTDMYILSDKFSQDNTDEGRLKYYKFSENFENFLTLASNLKASRVSEILNKLDSIFKDDGEGIVLSTIHKAKGLECDVVYILDEHLIPSKWAKSSKQLEQEENLKYVARTRAIHEMYFIDSKKLI